VQSSTDIERRVLEPAVLAGFPFGPDELAERVG